MAEKIVVLDGYTLNPGDIDWSPLAKLGQLVMHDRTGSDTNRIIERASDARFVLTNKTPLSAAMIGRLPALRYIGVLATGYNIVDVTAAREHGVTVSNVPTYGTDTVAQHAAGLMLELARHVGAHAQAVSQGQWVSSPDWCFTVAPIMELNGRNLGIAGLGRIGRQFATIGAAMGMRVLASASPRGPAATNGLNVEWVEMDDLFRRADVLSLHCPLTEETRHLVDARRLALMKPTALIINTSRGPLIDQAALAAALHAGRIAGAGLDVLDVEPPPADNPLLGAPRCLITPHIAWASRDARARLIQIAADNLAAFIAGRPTHVVN